jgi:alanyl-tRNA synthetase
LNLPFPLGTSPFSDKVPELYDIFNCSQEQFSMTNKFGIPYLTSNEIRNSFFSFYESKGHRLVRSSPIFPKDDPTILFTNSGMNQFKNILLGDDREGLKRVYNSQKCLRVSGKHNDLDEVGRDNYHHTFFEMLGHWSFGDYYKKEAITWMWELFTEVWKLPKNRLFASVHHSDQEAMELWKTQTDIEHKRIMKFDKPNFWEMGPVGPCGPCTEIHFDIGDLATQNETFADPILGVNGQNHRYIELINLVFMQNERMPDGSLKNLTQRHVDTGGGFERVCSIIQGTGSNYETDLFLPVLKQLSQLSGKAYVNDESGTPFRVIADHLRAISFAIADGVTPGNEGRGYVIRRILRRAARFAHEAGFKEPVIHKLVPTLVGIMGEAFPELKDRQSYITQVILAEESRFMKTLGHGLERITKLATDLKKNHKTTIPGDEIFALYDTYGFPVDLTAMIAAEQSLQLDLAGYETSMKAQRERARSAAKFDNSFNSDDYWTIIHPGKETLFTGYSETEMKVNVNRYMERGDEIYLVLDKTPFYAESGGQVGDQGTVSGNDIELKVTDTIKVLDMIVHRAELISGLLVKDNLKNLNAKVDSVLRERTKRNHSATHLLHAALKSVLGSHLAQQGSLVGPDRLRFDFTHHKGISESEMIQIETLVNQEIQHDHKAMTVVMDFETAKKSGAVALFGEKYGDQVRVLDLGPSSKELCGGTHVEATGQIGMFKIISEGSVAAGTRRIEAVTGMGALEYTRSQSSTVLEISQALKTTPDKLQARLEEMQDRIKHLDKRLDQAEQTIANSLADNLISHGKAIAGIKVVIGETDVNRESLPFILDSLAAKLSDGVSVLTHIDGEDLSILVTVGPSLHGKVKAGDLIKELAEVAGGKGGGRPDRARAGSKFPGRAQQVLSLASKRLEAVLGK